MRHEPTDAEKTLWQMLRSRRFEQFKFRRQVPVDHFIADFLCYEARLIIELDGTQHAESDYDRRRDDYLKAEGFRIIRFWNDDIVREPGPALDTIWHALAPFAAHHTPYPQD